MKPYQKYWRNYWHQLALERDSKMKLTITKGRWYRVTPGWNFSLSLNHWKDGSESGTAFNIVFWKWLLTLLWIGNER